MDNYPNGDNFRGREHKIRVDFQTDDYKGALISPPIGGNTFGLSVLKCIDDDIFHEMDDYEAVGATRFNVSEADDGELWFTLILHNEAGDELEIEMELSDLGDYIVGVSICDCKVRD